MGRGIERTWGLRAKGGIMPDKPLTAKQQAFISLYAAPQSETYNNAYQSAIKAGYGESAANQACKVIVGNCRVDAAITAFKQELEQKTVYSRQQRQQFWTKTMQEAPNMCDRLRASELLGRSEADFTDNINTRDAQQPADLTPQERKTLKDMAVTMTKPHLSKETA